MQRAHGGNDPEINRVCFFRRVAYAGPLKISQLWELKREASNLAGWMQNSIREGIEEEEQARGQERVWIEY